MQHPRLVVRRADVLDPTDVAACVAGQDAVLSALGIGYRRHRTTVYSEGLGNVMDGMRAAARMICVSTSGLNVPPSASRGQRLVFGVILHRVLREPYADMREMDTSADPDAATAARHAYATGLIRG